MFVWTFLDSALPVNDRNITINTYYLLRADHRKNNIVNRKKYDFKILMRTIGFLQILILVFLVLLTFIQLVQFVLKILMKKVQNCVLAKKIIQEVLN